MVHSLTLAHGKHGTAVRDWPSSAARPAPATRAEGAGDNWRVSNADREPVAADPDDSNDRRWYQRRTPLEAHEASRRLSAYVYGNILILAALVPFQEDTDARRAMVVVIGTALSTFIAHAFSEYLGGDGSVRPRALFRESMPILTTALVPLLLLWLSQVTRLQMSTALLVAEIVIVGRIASTGMVAARLRDEKSRLRVLLAGVVVAAVAFGIVSLKVALTH